MPQLPLSLLKAGLIFLLVAACSLPRGAALQSEILSESKSPNPEFALYSVTKSFLPLVATWPETGASNTDNWLGHQHQGSVSVIAVGDIINLTVWDSAENSLLTTAEQKVIKIENVQVSTDGSIFVPYLKQIRIAGLSDEAARRKIQQRLETIIPSAQVQLTSIAGMQRSVSLVGGVAAPGDYPIVDPHFTILNLISQGGGPATSLRNPQVKVIRSGHTYTASLGKIYANPVLDSVLIGGDKVILHDDERYFRSLGAAAKEQLIYFEKDSISALDAMSLIGGISNTRANPKGILILREYSKNAVRYNGTGPKNTRSIFVIDLTSSDGLFSAGRFQINSKDTVLVTESPFTAVNTVFGIIGSVFGIATTADDL